MRNLKLTRLSRSLKKKHLNKLVLFFSLGIILAGCALHKDRYYKIDSCPIDAPGWFFEPADPVHPGALGFANPSIQGENYSIILAKCRALNSLFNLESKKISLNCPEPYQSISNKELKKLKKKLEDVSVKNGIKFKVKKIKLPLYSESVIAVYAYSKNNKKFYLHSPKVCRCNMESCEPYFLCNLTLDGYAGSLGIAFRSFSFKSQYEIAVKRAVENFLYAYKARVYDKELIRFIHQGYTSFKLHLKEAIITPLGEKKDLRFVIRGLCMDKEGNLFVYVICPDIKVKKMYMKKPCWIENPMCLGEYVYVGIAGDNINGLKAQVSLALKRALIEMAKAKGVKISSVLLKRMDVDPFGVLQTVSGTTITNTEEKISAKIVGIYKKGGLLYIGIIAK